MNLLGTKTPVTPTACSSSSDPLLGDGTESCVWGWAKSNTGAVIPVALGAVLLWSYWPILGTIFARCWRDPQYSHGFLVPFFALFLLWQRRGQWSDETPAPSAWGVPLLALGIAMRFWGSSMDVDTLDACSLLPTLAGVAALVGGRQMLRRSWPAIAFLGFMMPPPYMLEQALSQPLRRLATVMSTYLLETLGYPALAEGNVILLDDVPLKVAEACSGLGMLATFFTLSTALAMLMRRRSWLEKVSIVCSAVPIAVLANVLRITATGTAHMCLGRQTANMIMHDLAGWLMMPLAVMMLWFYVWLTDRVFPRADDSAPLVIPLGISH
jgi:exosortase